MFSSVCTYMPDTTFSQTYGDMSKDYFENLVDTAFVRPRDRPDSHAVFID